MPSVQLPWDVPVVDVPVCGGPQPSPPLGRQMATKHWLQESTTKNVLKPTVKNGQPFYTKNYCNYLCKGEVPLLQGKYQHPLPSPHIFLLLLKHGPPMIWAPAVEQSQAFARVRLLTCTSSALQANILKLWPVHPNSESTPT